MPEYRRDGSLIVRTLTSAERALVYRYLQDRIREHNESLYVVGVKHKLAPELDPRGAELEYHLAAITALDSAAAFVAPSCHDGAGGRGTHDPLAS